MEKRFGLLGETLGHSHSKTLHALLGKYSYDLWPTARENLDAFMTSGIFDGLNVTIPYKQAVIPYLSEMGETAKRIGCVNTIVRRKDGSLFGDNTDAYGMQKLSESIGANFAGQKAVILGSGGTSLTARDVVTQAGGQPVIISRHGGNNYQNLSLHRDAAYLINTTPVGMLPNVENAPVDLTNFPHLKGVLDVVYNPLRTRLILQAQSLGIPCAGGLKMLVYQAVRASELFTGESVEPEKAALCEATLRKSVMNLVLVGMPGCGKSTIGKLLKDRLSMPLVDIDEEIEKAAGMTIPEIFEREKEVGFRQREAEQIARFASCGGQILVTGGGAVKREDNRRALQMNGFVVHITRPLENLATSGRPLSKGQKELEKLWSDRAPLYRDCADCTVENNADINETVSNIREAFDEAARH